MFDTRPHARVRVVASGVTSAEDAVTCAEAGVDAVACLVEYPFVSSLDTWNLSRQAAAEVLAAVPPYVGRVAVVGGETEHLLRVVEAVRPHVVELQADEPPETVHDVVDGLRGSGVRVTKVFLVCIDDVDRMKAVDWHAQATRFLEAGADAIAFDAASQERTYGTRIVCEEAATPATAQGMWPMLADVCARLSCVVGLEGGLIATNVADAVRQVEPSVVSAIRPLEDQPGRKSHEAVAAFIHALERGASRSPAVGAAQREGAAAHGGAR
jgi:phosphoribosylanthranilate isomerase